MTPDDLLKRAIRRHAMEKEKETMKEFVNDSTQAERKAVVKNDQRSTYLDHAIANAEMEAQGRFAKVNATTVVGVPQVPKQPETSPFHHDPCGPEAPLGYDINEVVAVGSPSEIQASIAVNLQKALDEGSRVPRAPDVLPDPAPTKRRY